ncbi:MAG: hypothetical protein Q7P63_04485 [Verrucomicrobiota bacterium JB022]|nr:hypothetical protein [Verrucomicrobiota bacterium JB022]
MFAGLIAGVFAALVMHLFMRLVSRSPAIDVDMTRVVSTVLHHDAKASGPLPLVLHLFLGACFGAAYTVIFAWFGDFNAGFGVLMGAVLGFFQGMIVGFALMYGAAESSPDRTHYRATWQIGIVHLAAHVIFGVVLGFIVGAI